MRRGVRAQVLFNSQSLLISVSLYGQGVMPFWLSLWTVWLGMVRTRNSRARTAHDRARGHTRGHARDRARHRGCHPDCNQVPIFFIGVATSVVSLSHFVLALAHSRARPSFFSPGGFTLGGALLLTCAAIAPRSRRDRAETSRWRRATSS